MPAPEPTPAGRNDHHPGDDDRDGASDRSRPIESAESQSRRLWLLAAAAGLAYGVSLRDAPYPDQAAAKVLMCALLFLACARHEPISERVRLMAALAASAVGDALLALPQLTFSFVGGLGAFLVAHLAYCALLAPRAVRTGLWRGVEAWRRIAIALLCVAAVAMYIVFLPNLGPLAVPVALYMLALCAMASCALLVRPSGPALPLGGLAFVASDAMIGVDRFLGAFHGSGYAIWFTYVLAQVSIVGGLLRSGAR